MVKLTQLDSRTQLRGQFIWFACWLVITAIALYLNPNPAHHGTHRQLGLPACPSVLMFDRPCPGCGLTTAFAFMVRGQIVPAFQCNAFGPVLYLSFTASALACGWYWFKKIHFDTNTRPMNWALGTLAVGLATYGVLRFMFTQLDDPDSVRAYRPSVRKESGQSTGVPEQSAARETSLAGQIH